MRQRRNILIVDDNRYFREIVRNMLERDTVSYKVWEAESVSQATYLIDTMPLDIVLLDARLGDEEDGLDVADYVKKKKINVPLLGLTTFEGSANILHLVKAGVRGILLKSTTGPQELDEAIQKILSGEKYYPERVQTIIDENLHKLNELPTLRLTERERILLREMEKGYTAKDISRHTNITVSSVETTRKRLQEKTDTHSTSELVAYAFRNGLLP
ncbi:MAG TPA: response regulator transcription factor [Cyclobacteriaceae bacterium]